MSDDPAISTNQAAKFFGPILGPKVVARRARIVNRYFDASEDRRQERRDVPLVEDFPLTPREETPDFKQLTITLELRMFRAHEHWNGKANQEYRIVANRVNEGVLKTDRDASHPLLTIQGHLLTIPRGAGNDRGARSSKCNSVTHICVLHSYAFLNSRGWRPSTDAGDQLKAQTRLRIFAYLF